MVKKISRLLLAVALAVVSLPPGHFSTPAAASTYTETLNLNSDVGSNITWNVTDNMSPVYTALADNDNSTRIIYQTTVSNISSVFGVSNPSHPVGNITALSLVFDAYTNGSSSGVATVGVGFVYRGKNKILSVFTSGGPAHNTYDILSLYGFDSTNLTADDIDDLQVYITGKATTGGSEYPIVMGARIEISYEASNSVLLTTSPIYGISDPVWVFGTIDSRGWEGNVTQFGYRAGSANGTWDYDAIEPITFDDPYGIYDNSLNSIFVKLYGIAPNTTYYCQPFAAGYSTNGSVYTVFYGEVQSFTTAANVTNPTFAAQTGNMTQIINPTTSLPAIILTGSYTTGQYPVTSWGFLVGNTSASVANLSVSTQQFSHTGTGTGVWQDTWDISGNTTRYARAYAINNRGSIVYGDIVSLTPTTIADPTITNAAPSIVGNTVILYANVSTPTVASQYAFQYGTSNNTSSFQTWAATSSGTVYALTGPVLTLQSSTTYYYRARIYTDHWIDGPIASLTTGASNNATVGAPQIVTYPAGNLTDTSFTVPVYINGANLTIVGVEYKLAADPFWMYVTTLNTSGAAGTYNITITGLTANTTYYFRGIGFNTQLQKGIGTTYNVMTLPTLNPVRPVLTTGEAFDITVASFKTAIVVAGSNLTFVGVEYRLVTDTAWGDAGNISVNDTGTYEMTVSGLAANASYYFRGYAQGITRELSLNVRTVRTLAVGEVAPIPTTPGDIRTFKATLQAWMQSLGMDNDTGHWAFMGLLILIEAAIFGGAAIYFTITDKKSKLIPKVLMGIAAVVAVVIVATFLFSGLLGIWAVAALVAAVVVFIFIIVTPIINGGRASAHG